MFAASNRKKFSLSAMTISMLLIPLLITNNGTNQTSYVKVESIILPSSVHSLSYSPNGSLLAVAYGRYYDYYGIQNKDDPPHWDGGVAIISTRSWKIIKILEGHSGKVEAIWRPQGDILATVSLDKTLIFWNVSSWEILRRITIPQAHDYGPQNQIAFTWSPDGKKFAVSICDEAIWIYSFSNQTILGKFKAGPKAILTLTWSPDGHYLASGGWTYTVNIWDMKIFKLVKELELGGSKALAWSPDGKLLATSGRQVFWASEIGPKSHIGKLIVWNTESWKPVSSQNLSFVSCLSWSLDSKKLAVARWERTFIIYETDTWNIANKILDTYGVRLVQWNPNSRELATGMYDPNGTVSIWQEYTKK